MDVIKNEVEAILFSAGRTVLLKEFQALLRVKEPGMIVEKIKQLQQEYTDRDSPMMIVEEDDGWKLTVKERFLPTVQSINPHTELSKTVLETLAVISWKAPVLQSEVIKIRTNKAYDHISELERLGFITKKREGRSFMINVTQKFLDYFDLPDARAIKGMFSDFKDIESAVQGKADDFRKEQEKVKADEQDAGKSEADAADVEGAGEEAKAELEEFSDELPPIEKPKHELEVYEPSKVDIERHPPDLDAEEEDEEGRASEDAAETSESGPSEESEEEPAHEKVRRLAKELLGETEAEDEARAEETRRELHPELEKFIEGVESPHRTVPEPHRSAEEAPEEGEEEDAEAEQEAGPEEGSEESDASEENDSKSGPKSAEEFPGQFKAKVAEATEDEESDDEPAEEHEEASEKHEEK